MLKLPKTWKKDVLIGIGILSLAFLLRIYNLTIIPVFGDEAIYIRWAQIMRVEPTLRFIPLSDGKQPLFMWSVIPFLKIFTDPLVAGRLVSVFSGIGTLIGVYILTLILFKSRRIAFISSLLYAISPFSVFFDRLALADSMLSFFGVWTLIFSLITVKTIRLDTAMLTGFFLGGAFLTKSPALFYALLMPLSLILYKFPKGYKEKFNRISVFTFLFFFTYLIAYGMYNILRLGPNFHMIAIRNSDYVYPLSHFLVSPFDPLKPFINRSLEYIWILGPGIVFLLLMVGILTGFKKYKKEILVILAWLVIPILVSSELSKTMTARYIYFSVPYLFVISAISFFNDKTTYFLKDNAFKLVKKFLKVNLGLLIIYSLFTDFLLLTDPQKATLPRSERSGYLEEWTSGYGIKEVADYIRNEYKNDKKTKIVTGTEGYFGTLPDGLQIYLNDIPEITVIGVGLPIRDLPKSLAESKSSGNKTYLVVNNTRLEADSEKLGLRLIAVYNKALRPDRTQESLLLFEVSDEAVKTKP